MAITREEAIAAVGEDRVQALRDDLKAVLADFADPIDERLQEFDARVGEVVERWLTEQGSASITH